MPSTETITSFNSFSPNTLIRSAQINTNFSVFRGHLLPVNTDTATSSDATHNLGAPTHRWANTYTDILGMTGQSTPSANPTAGAFKLYFKSDGILYRINSSGTESAFSPSPLTTKGDMAVYDTATSRFPVGSNNTVLTADSSATFGMAWKAATGASVIVNATTTHAATITTDVLIHSGASFTTTLPTGTSGKVMTLIHNGTSLSQIYTINCSNSETVDNTTTVGMYTNGEALTLVFSGTNWHIRDHKTETGWIDGGAISMTATGTALAKGATITVDRVSWKRRGNTALFRYEYRQTSGGTAGTGIYLVGLPTGMTIDTTYFSSSTNTTTTGTTSDQQVAAGHGKIGISNGAGRGFGAFQIHNTTQLALHITISFTAFNLWGASTYPLTDAALGWGGTVELPISGWLP